MSRRNDFQIARDILFLAQGPVRKTEIVYGANLNFRVVKTYLKDLMARGLLKNEGQTYRTTRDGREYIQLVAEIETKDARGVVLDG